MLQKYWSPLTFTFMWLVLVITAVYTRPALPVDETRYLAVAWEMWMRGDFLVPHLNGETYSHKPPLLFWLMNLGWAIFGVNDWWPPLVAPLFALACLFLTRSMAQKLWPEKPEIADLSPIILLGAAFWTLFTTVTMFDMLVAACTLWALLGILIVWRDGERRGWWIFGVAIGIGILAKGPVILLQVLPIALLAPVWDREGLIKTRDGGWKRWYFRIFLSVLGGAVIGLSWAIPAGIYGGEEYRNAIFWGQTAGRVVKSFAHARPWWWYLAVIGPLLLPWVIWPTVWRCAKAKMFELWSHSQIRFCILWFVPIFVAFSLISGKQLHYLLPIFPAFAFVLAWMFLSSDVKEGRWARLLPAGLLALVGILVMLAPFVVASKIPSWAQELSTLWMLPLIAVALFVAIKPMQAVTQAAIGLSAMMTTFVVIVHVFLMPYLDNAFDFKDMSDEIKKMQDDGYAVAFVGKYHGTFQFLGRLEQPIAELESNRSDLKTADWVKDNPKSKVITFWKPDAPDHVAVDLVQKYRTRQFIIFDVSKLNGDLSLLQRR